MSTFITIIAGVTVYVIGQLIIKLVVDPIQAFKSTVGEISIALINNANVYANPGIQSAERNNEASKEFRLLASILSARVNLIPKYEWTSKVFALPSRDEIHEAKSKLILLSNNLHVAGYDVQGMSPGMLNSRQAEKISDILGIYVPEGSRVYQGEKDA
jgi:hypothetical protein